VLKGLEGFCRKGLDLEADTSVQAVRVLRPLNQIFEWRGQPMDFGVNNGPQNVRAALQTWADKRPIGLLCVQSGKLRHCQPARYRSKDGGAYVEG
jgi:hypothetical protein